MMLNQPQHHRHLSATNSGTAAVMNNNSATTPTTTSSSSDGGSTSGTSTSSSNGCSPFYSMMASNNNVTRQSDCCSAMFNNSFSHQQQTQQQHSLSVLQQQQFQLSNTMSNIPAHTLSSILSDPNAFPSLSQLVQSNNSLSSSNSQLSLSSSSSCMTPTKNTNNNINGNSTTSPHKYSKVQCTEQSILLQRCPNSDYKFIHEFGTDYISNSIIFKKFTSMDIENLFLLFQQNVKLQNKTCKNYVFEQCFDGQEAFLLLQEILLTKFNNLLNDVPITKLALHLGQYLLTIGKFNHVCREHCFKNVNLLFYQFGSSSNLQFNELKVTNSPNWYLTYPSIDSFIVQQSTNSVQLFQCNIPIREQFSPVFSSISINELKEILLAEVLPYEEGVEMLCRNDDIYLYTFHQKTKFQEYPDYITIQLLSVQSSVQKSTIAVYSRCKYGYSDWGNNKERVNSWISKIVSKCQTHVISRKCSI